MSAKSALFLLRDKYRREIFASDVINWAVQELIEGQDSDSLRRLSALRKPTDWWEVEPLLHSTFQELGYEWPDEKTCYWRCAKKIAEDIVAGNLLPSPGAAAMYRLCVELSFPRELINWEYITSNLEPETFKDLRKGGFAKAVLSEAKKFLDGLPPTA